MTPRESPSGRDRPCRRPCRQERQKNECPFHAALFPDRSPSPDGQCQACIHARSGSRTGSAQIFLLDVAGLFRRTPGSGLRVAIPAGRPDVATDARRNGERAGARRTMIASNGDSSASVRPSPIRIATLCRQGVENLAGPASGATRSMERPDPPAPPARPSGLTGAGERPLTSPQFQGGHHQRRRCRTGIWSDPHRWADGRNRPDPSGASSTRCRGIVSMAFRTRSSRVPGPGWVSTIFSVSCEYHPSCDTAFFGGMRYTASTQWCRRKPRASRVTIR